MKKSVLASMFAVVTAVLGGCGSSLQEFIVEASLASAKESIEEAVDETVDGLVDDLVGIGDSVLEDEQSDE